MSTTFSYWSQRKSASALRNCVAARSMRFSTSFNSPLMATAGTCARSVTARLPSLVFVVCANDGRAKAQSARVKASFIGYSLKPGTRTEVATVEVLWPFNPGAISDGLAFIANRFVTRQADLTSDGFNDASQRLASFVV